MCLWCLVVWNLGDPQTLVQWWSCYIQRCPQRRLTWAERQVLATSHFSYDLYCRPLSFMISSGQWYLSGGEFAFSWWFAIVGTSYFPWPLQSLFLEICQVSSWFYHLTGFLQSLGGFACSQDIFTYCTRVTLPFSWWCRRWDKCSVLMAGRHKLIQHYCFFGKFLLVMGLFPWGLLVLSGKGLRTSHMVFRENEKYSFGVTFW